MAAVTLSQHNLSQRYMVLPERPKDTEGLSEEELGSLVSRDSMIGVAVL